MRRRKLINLHDKVGVLSGIGAGVTEMAEVIFLHDDRVYVLGDTSDAYYWVKRETVMTMVELNSLSEEDGA